MAQVLKLDYRRISSSLCVRKACTQVVSRIGAGHVRQLAPLCRIGRFSIHKRVEMAQSLYISPKLDEKIPSAVCWRRIRVAETRLSTRWTVVGGIDRELLEVLILFM
jgi:hypothetical protein